MAVVYFFAHIRLSKNPLCYPSPWPGVVTWYRERDSNPHGLGPLVLETSASVNSAIPAHGLGPRSGPSRLALFSYLSLQFDIPVSLVKELLPARESMPDQFAAHPSSPLGLDRKLDEVHMGLRGQPVILAGVAG